MRRCAFVLVTVVLLSITAPAWGGGSFMNSTEETYQPGVTVRGVAYLGSASSGEPIVARMNLVPIEPATEHVAPIWHKLGPVNVEPTGLGRYMSYRIFTEFTLPSHLEPGSYWVQVFDGSGRLLGDLIGLRVMVGIEPSEPRWIEWPLDEPLIAELPADDVIAVPGFAVTVAELRAGNYPVEAEEFMLHPETLSQAGIATTPTTLHAPRVYGSEVGEGFPAPPTPIVEMEPADDGSVSGPAVIGIVVGLFAAPFRCSHDERAKPDRGGTTDGAATRARAIWPPLTASRKRIRHRACHLRPRHLPCPPRRRGNPSAARAKRCGEA